MHRTDGGMRTLVDFIPISIIEEGTDNGGRTLIGQTMRIVSGALLKGGVFTGKSVYGAIDGLYKSGRVQRLWVVNSDAERQVDEVERESERKKGIVSAVIVGALSRLRDMGDGSVLTLRSVQDHLYTGDKLTGVSPYWTMKTVGAMNCADIRNGVITEVSDVVVRVPNSAEINGILNPEGLVEKIQIARDLVDIFNSSPSLCDFYSTPECKRLRDRWVELHRKSKKVGNLPKGKSTVLSVTPSQLPKQVVNYGTHLEHLIWSLVEAKLSNEELKRYRVNANGSQYDASIADRSLNQLNLALTLRLSERSERSIPPNTQELPPNVLLKMGTVSVLKEHNQFKDEYGEALREALYKFERLESIVYIADIKERDLNIVDYVRFAEGVQALYSIGAITLGQMNRIMAEVEFPKCEMCGCRKYCSIPNRDRVESSKTSEVKTVKSPGHREKFTNAIIERMRRIRWMRNIPPTEGRNRVLGDWEVGSDGQARPRQTDKAPNPTVPDPRIMDSAEQEEDRLRRSLENFLLEKRKSEETSGKSPKKTKSSPTPATIPWSPDEIGGDALSPVLTEPARPRRKRSKQPEGTATGETIPEVETDNGKKRQTSSKTVKDPKAQAGATQRGKKDSKPKRIGTKTQGFKPLQLDF